MAKILGEMGKISLKFRSGTGIEEFKQKFSLTNSELAAFLRNLAQEIESGGKVEVAYGRVSLCVNPMSPIWTGVGSSRIKSKVRTPSG